MRYGFTFLTFASGVVVGWALGTDHGMIAALMAVNGGVCLWVAGEIE